MLDDFSRSRKVSQKKPEIKVVDVGQCITAAGVDKTKCDKNYAGYEVYNSTNAEITDDIRKLVIGLQGIEENLPTDSG